MRALLPFVVALAAPAGAEDVPPGFAWTYLCDGGAVLQVAYLNPEAGPSLAVVAWGGELVPMQAGPTGSGVRYVAFDPAAGYVWHAKGDEGFLAREEGSEQVTLLENCRRAGG